MKTIRVNKTTLIESVKANRIKHEEANKVALEGFYTAVEKELKTLLKQAKSRDLPAHIYLENQKPKEYLADYDTALEMLELSVDTEIEITQEEFKNLVKDEWSWKDVWELSNSRYSG